MVGIIKIIKEVIKVFLFKLIISVISLLMGSFSVIVVMDEFYALEGFAFVEVEVN